MPRNELAPKQQQYYDWLKDWLETNDGIWPTYKETLRHFGWRSPNSITQNIKALYRKGFLVRHGVHYKLAEHMPPENGIPVKGVISAGHLQEAIESDLGVITIETLFPKLENMFALQVSGQSMIGADIRSGDYVILVDDDIPNGGIGAVLYLGETSLKRIFLDKDGLRLEPANPEYEDIRIDPDVFEEVTVLGRYVGHVNRNGIHKARPVPRHTGPPKVSRFHPR